MYEEIILKEGRVNVCSSKRIPLVFLILTIIIFFQSYFIIGISAFNFPFDEFNEEGYVHRVINNEIDPDVYLFPAINIVKLSNNIAESQLELKLNGLGNLSSRFEYRILVGWNEGIFHAYLYNWSNIDWNNAIRSQSNFTACIAGGTSWSGISNGSFSAFYDSTETLVFSEQNNNSVIIFENNTLIFPIDETYIEDPATYTDVQVFASYNATINTTTSDFYVDAMPHDLLLNMFTMLTPDAVGYSTFYSFLLILFSGLSIATYVKKKKVRL